VSVVRESGEWKGKAKIKGGRKSHRQAIYMPTFVAPRYNPDFKAKYDQLRKVGKPAELAITEFDHDGFLRCEQI